MMRRLILLLALIASLSLAASPALGATASTYLERGSALSAFFSNVEFAGDNLAPGQYAETSVDAASQLSTNSEDFKRNYVCVNHWEFTVDGDGNWTDESGFGACGEADTFAVDRRLSSGHVVASLPVEECLVWDEETKECLEWISLGDLEIDLVFTGVGTVERAHGVYVGGLAGDYQVVFHGTGSRREAAVGGELSLDGVSLIDGATLTGGSMSQVRTGYIEVSH